MVIIGYGYIILDLGACLYIRLGALFDCACQQTGRRILLVSEMINEIWIMISWSVNIWLRMWFTVGIFYWKYIEIPIISVSRVSVCVFLSPFPSLSLFLLRHVRTRIGLCACASGRMNERTSDTPPQKWRTRNEIFQVVNKQLRWITCSGKPHCQTALPPSSHTIRAVL